VQAVVPAQLGELRDGLSRIAERLAGVFDQVREISHGIHPAILSERGLVSALRGWPARPPEVPVELDLRSGRRLPESVEIAAYYAVSEALANAAKHARASGVHVELDARDARVRVAIRDDGTGAADAARGPAWSGSATASRRSAARSRSLARSAAVPHCSSRFQPEAWTTPATARSNPRGRRTGTAVRLPGGPGPR
jgi:Histidine kinase-like ATPase domain